MKKVDVIVSFYFAILLFLSFSLLTQRVFLQKRATEEELLPYEVKISNIAPKSFTVSWFTKGKTSGAILFSDSKEVVEKLTGNIQTATDVRGPATWSQTHYALLENLNPNQNYYFVIKSGTEVFYKRLDGVWDKNGLATEQKTAPGISFDPNQPPSPTNSEGSYSLEAGAWSPCGDGTQEGKTDPCFRPNLVWGSTVDEKGIPVKEVIVFLEIPGKSSFLSSISEKEGRWTFNLANLLNNNLSEFISYNPETDLVRLWAADALGQTVSTYQLVPHVFAQNCLNIPFKECGQSPLDLTNPVTLVLTLLQPSPTPFPTFLATPTPTPSLTPQTSAPSIFAYLKITSRFQGINQKSLDKTVDILFRKPGEEILVLKQKINFVADDSGNYHGRSTAVPTGTFDIFLKEPFHLSRKISSFKVNFGENTLDVTSFPFLAGDLDNNNRIDMIDLGILLGEFRTTETQTGIAADLNSDGRVNSEDLGILISNYRMEGD